MSRFENTIKTELNEKTFAQLNADVLVEAAKEEGTKMYALDIKNNQLRKFYDTVKQIERKPTLRKMKGTDHLSDDVVAQLVFLRPHLANAVEKAKGKTGEAAMRRLQQVLDVCLSPSVLKTKDDLGRFVKFFEAIVAFTHQ